MLTTSLKGGSMRRIVVGFVLLLLVGGACSARPERFVGEGTPISTKEDCEVIANQACWICHGWGGAAYPREQADIKDLTGDRSVISAGKMTFRLYIDGMEVDLNSMTFGGPGNEPGVHEMYMYYYMQFPPNYFVAGETYELMGVWDSPNPNNYYAAILPWATTSTLTVLEP